MKKSEPRNEGRRFTAWCGGQYVFAHNREGKLCVKPPTYNWWVIDSIQEMYRQFTEKLEEKIDVEAGWKEVVRQVEEDHPDTGKMRRHLKNMSFHRRYSR